MSYAPASMSHAKVVSRFRYGLWHANEGSLVRSNTEFVSALPSMMHGSGSGRLPERYRCSHALAVEDDRLSSVFVSWMPRDGFADDELANKQSAGECFAVSAPGV